MNVLKSWFALCLLLLTTTLFGQQFHANVVAIDTCENYLVLSQVPGPEFAAAGVFFFVQQHDGAAIMTEDNEDFGTLTDLNGAGRYELNRVALTVEDTIFAQFKIRHDYLTANDATGITLSPPQTSPISTDQVASNFNGQNGGILLLASDGILQISANLSAAGAGYAGGATEIWDSQCNAFTGANDYFYPTTTWRGAYKGQGAALASQLFGKETGRGPSLNGGGGGNDHNSGGGGGGNIAAGGNGAANEEPGLFNCKGNFPGLGGRALPATQSGVQRVYFGGGGGAGHGNNDNPTGGGNGGGIIVLSAPQIEFIGSPSVSVAGQNAELVDGDGGGGGGAGGTILLFSENVNADVQFDIGGGNGAEVTNNNQNRCFGPGGGGGGGRLLHIGPPAVGWTLNINGGQGGESLNSQACDPGENVAQNGFTGFTESILQTPISIQEALQYPDAPIVLDSACVGQSLSIGRPNDQSCFVAQWFINTPNAYESLAGNPDYGPTNGPGLDIISLPTPAIGDVVEYRLERYGRNGAVIAVLTYLVPIRVDASADFSFGSDQLTVNFTNNSSGNTSQQWFFGDGNGSSQINPQHSYQASGTYQVTLIVEGPCGVDTLVQTIEVLATAPVAIIGGALPLTVCIGDTFKLYNLSENATEIEWGVGLPGVFILPDFVSDTICVITENLGGASVILTAANLDQDDVDAYLFFVVGEPNYTINTSVAGNTLTATADGNFGVDLFWVLPSGDTIVGDTLVNVFPGPGEYEIQFIASNGTCPDQIEIFTVIIFEPTQPQIGLLIPQGCTPFTAQFLNQTTGPVDSILWTNEVASPNSSTEDTLTLVFPDAGVFTVTLTVYSPNGTFTETAQVEVFSSPEVDFTLEEINGLLTTINLSQNATNYQWDFGDGNGSTDFEPEHHYTSTGTYEVTLNAFNAACNRAISQSIFVDMILSVQELSELGVEVFPNPVQDQLYLRGPVDGWTLFDPTGKSIRSSSEQSLNQITMEDLPTGTYFLRLQVLDREVTVPIIKQ